MKAHENLHQAVLAMLNLTNGEESTEVITTAATGILIAFAEVVRGPAPEIAGVELVADNTQAQVLAELQQQTALLKRIVSFQESVMAAGESVQPVVVNQVSALNDRGLNGFSRDEEWRIQIVGNHYFFSRYIGGKAVETYGSVRQDQAAVCAVAVIEGYEPPRSLRRSDTRVGQKHE